MKRWTRSGAVCLAALVGAASVTPVAFAQGAAALPLEKATLSDAAAKRALTDREINIATATAIVQACVSYAASKNAGASVVVISPSGHIVHAYRTDGQTPNNIDSAYQKAKTALYMRAPTRTVFNRWGSPDQQLARANLDLYLVPGGFPIVVGDRLIGAVGVGGAGAAGDDECAHEAMTKVLGPQPALATAQGQAR
jgi:glc operon protein GlcG